MCFFHYSDFKEFACCRYQCSSAPAVVSLSFRWVIAAIEKTEEVVLLLYQCFLCELFLLLLSLWYFQLYYYSVDGVEGFLRGQTGNLPQIVQIHLTKMEVYCRIVGWLEFSGKVFYLKNKRRVFSVLVCLLQTDREVVYDTWIIIDNVSVFPYVNMWWLFLILAVLAFHDWWEDVWVVSWSTNCKYCIDWHASLLFLCLSKCTLYTCVCLVKFFAWYCSCHWQGITHRWGHKAYPINKF